MANTDRAYQPNYDALSKRSALYKPRFESSIRRRPWRMSRQDRLPRRFSGAAESAGRFVDLMFADPPYNLTKSFNDRQFRKTSIDEYSEWLDSWLAQTVRYSSRRRLFTSAATGVARCDSPGLVKIFHPQNRITWEREKAAGEVKLEKLFGRYLVLHGY